MPGANLCVGYRDLALLPDEAISGIRCYDLGIKSRHAGWRTFKGMTEFAKKTAFLSDYDWVLYSGYNAPVAVHNHPRGANLLYCHTIPRFVYDLRDYYLDIVPCWQKPMLKALIHFVQPRYEAAYAKMDQVIANSETVQKRIKHYLGRDSVVVYPPCDVDHYVWQGQGGYYLSTARLERYKRVDLIIDAFRRMPEKRLVIVSGGSDSIRLKRLAAGADNIQFMGWVDNAVMQKLIGQAIATLYIAKNEDFGISPVESMAAGKPVIGVREGGLLETVIHDETGLLLPPDPEVEHIIAAVQELTAQRAAQMRLLCEARARLFHRDIFMYNMQALINATGY